MGDPGFVSGLIGVGIDIAIKEIAERIKLALYCKKELRKLQEKLNSISPINTAIQKYRVGVKLGEINVTNGNDTDIVTPRAVNVWLKKLNTLVTQANVLTDQCCVRMPTYNLISRYRLSKRIRQVVAEMDEHLGTADLIGITIDLASNVKLGQGLQYIQHQLEDLRNSSTHGSSSDHPMQRFQPVHEPLIVGQGEVFEKLQKRILDRDKGLACMGVYAMGGAGKTLLLKTVLNSKEVQDSFKQDLVLWLTVSHNPSIIALRRNLGRLVALQINEPFNDRIYVDENVRLWIEEKMKTRRFLLFLDDVWDSQNLLEELGVPAETVDGCKVIVSTRDKRILPKMGVNLRDSIELGFLTEDESWKLFMSHAFAYNNHQIPPGIEEETARNVCKECDRLPLAIKVIAATMAGVTDPVEWEVMLERLRNAVALNQEVQEKLYNRLRLSYDALGRYDPSLQLCYLYIAAFKEDEDMYLEDLINLWIGEGLVTTTRPGEDPLEIGRVQANLLLDRCLIEASILDADGQVMVCSMHDVLHDLALQIAESEEDCLYRAGKNMEIFPEMECLGRTRISLMENNFSSIPDTFEGGHVLSLLLSENKSLKQFPARTMATMTWIRVLDLGGTSLEQLPKSFGGMRQLVCLRLASVPIKELPESIVKLRKLQILELSNCNKLRHLPSRIDQLVCLRYLDLSGCQGLQCIPLGISRLVSLQYLRTERSWQAWKPKVRVKRNLYEKAMAKLNSSGEQSAACFSDLRGLTQLKWLGLEEWQATLQNETLGMMIEMRTLVLRLDSQIELPNDMVEMRKLRTLFLSCRDLKRTPPWLSEFQHLTCLILSCEKLEELCPLHKLPRLRRLDISGGMVGSDKLKKLPPEFGESDAFPVLERFWLEKLMVIGEIPVLQDGAMPKLKKLGIGVCPRLKLLPRGLLRLEHLQQIQVYSCTLALQRMEEGREDWDYIRELQNKGVEVIKEYVGDKRLKEISKRMGDKYWWDRFVKEMWMNFHM